MDLQLQANQVVLGAGDTGCGRATADDLVGLNRALAHAGARDIIVSLWPVDDQGAKILMVDFHGRLQRGESVALALRRAQPALLGEGRCRGPRSWGTFVVMAGVSAPPP